MQLAEHDAAVARLIDSTGPLVTPYDALVNDDGWLVDVASAVATAPFDDPAVDRSQRIVNALLIACDYAVRRGAVSVTNLRGILDRESPIAIVANPGTPKEGELATQLGIAVSSANDRPASFARRAAVHAALAFDCDPVLSFQAHTLDWDMGDSTLSSFVVHNQGVRDGVTVDGDVGERWAVTVGLPSSTSYASLSGIELQVASMPSFLSGVTSRFDGQALVVGWAAGEAPDIEQIGEAMRVWTKALYDLDLVDVRIVFAPPVGRSAELTKMRSWARSFRLHRDTVAGAYAVPDSAEVSIESKATRK
jgi:hypothetical protein